MFFQNSRAIRISLLAVAVFSGRVWAQAAAPPPGDDQNQKHILWIIPNYRTSPTLAEYKPIPPKEKFRIASQDSFDRGTVALAAVFAGFSQLNGSNPSFGGGVKGYAHRWGTAYADFVVGNFMTEGVYPTLLHQDPRYFRRGFGNVLGRLVYSAGQILLTHGESGQTQFNFSEIAGNSTAVAVSMSYYPDSRNAHDAVSALASQLAVDAASNIVKEFWPDLNRKFSRKSKGIQ